MQNFRLFVFIFLISLWAQAQIGGQSVYQFLNLVTSPRQAALGGKVIALHDYDVNQLHFNPASLNDDMHNRLGVNYGNLFGEVGYGTASYVRKINDKHLFSAGINFIDYGTFDGRDENGNATGDFTGNEASFSVGYAYKIPNSKFQIGVNTKLITSTLETYNSFGAAIDLAAMYVNPESKLNYGLVVRNFGTQFTTYAGLNEPLPTEILFGISKELENVPVRWHLVLDNLQQWDVSYSNPNRTEESLDGTETPEKVSFMNNALRHVILGAEIFTGRSFNLRVGYNFRRGEELKIEDQRNFSGFSFGFGLRFNNLRFDYSYSRYTLAANTSLFGVMIKL